MLNRPQLYSIIIVLLASSCGDGPAAEPDAFIPPDGAADATIDGPWPDAALPLTCATATLEQPSVVRLDFSITNILIDAANVYLLRRDSTSNGSGAVVRVSRATGETTILASGLYTQSEFTQDADYIYVPTSGVVRIPKAGGPKEVVLSEGVADDVAVTDSYIYAFAGHPGHLWRVAKAGGDPVALRDHSFSTMLRSFGGKLYWIDHDNPFSHRIVELDADTTPPGQGEALLRPMAIFQDARHLVMTSAGPVWSTADRISYTPYETTPAQSIFPNEGHISFFSRGESLMWFASGFGTTTMYEYDPAAGQLSQTQQFAGRADRVVEDATHYYYLYIGYDDPPYFQTPGSIWRLSKVPGAAPEQLAADQYFPKQLALDDTHVYWANSGTPPYYDDGEIMRVAKAGGAPEVVFANLSYPEYLVLDGGTLYWTSPGDGGVRSAPTDASGPVSVLALATDTAPRSLVLHDNTLYWADVFNHKIVALDLSTSLQTEFAPTQNGAHHLHVHGAHLYWEANERVFRKPLAGGFEQVLAFNQTFVTSLFVHGDSVYVQNQYNFTVFRIATDGSGVASQFAYEGANKRLYSDGASVFWATDNKIRHKSLSGGAVSSLISASQPVGWIAVDPDVIYWTQHSDGETYLACASR